MTLREQIRRLRGFPPHALVGKAVQELRFIGRGLRFRRARLNPPATLAVALPDRLDHLSMPQVFRQAIAERFPISPADGPRLLSALRSCRPDAEDRIVREADRTCDHVFDLLGSGDSKLGTPIDWHSDFIHAHRWPRRCYYRRIRPAPYPGGYDLKVPWELSRCQHFARLGQAYWITQDERYAREFVAQWTHWTTANPRPLGVNWACAMEVAIRAVNVLWGLAFMQESPHVTDAFLVLTAASLFEHGDHVFTNLEGGPGNPRNGNHYFSDLVGLIYLSVCCPFFRTSAQWRQFAVQELWAEVLHQFLPDGANFESSTAYHRLVTELALSAMVLCRRAGITAPEPVLRRMERAVDFVDAIQMPDGTAPVVGDADNGRLHRLAVWSDPVREWCDFRYLLAIGQQFLGIDRYDVPREHWQEAVWLLGAVPAADGDGSRTTCLNRPPARRSSEAFTASGVHIMRHDDLYLLVQGGMRGERHKTSHVHSDLASITVHAGGQSWIVDPGCSTYTADYRLRNLDRSTLQHNTVSIDLLDQHAFSPRDLFNLASVAVSRIENWQTDAKLDLLEMSHDGYQRLPDPVLHRRKILFDKRQRLWIVGDDIQCAAPHRATLSYHFGHGIVNRDAASPSTAFLVGDASASRLLLQLFSRLSTPTRLENGWVAPGYGCRHAAPVLRIEAEIVNQARIAVLLLPLPPGQSARTRFTAVQQQVYEHLSAHFGFEHPTKEVSP